MNVIRGSLLLYLFTETDLIREFAQLIVTLLWQDITEVGVECKLLDPLRQAEIFDREFFVGGVFEVAYGLCFFERVQEKHGHDAELLRTQSDLILDILDCSWLAFTRHLVVITAFASLCLSVCRLSGIGLSVSSLQTLREVVDFVAQTNGFALQKPSVLLHDQHRTLMGSVNQ